MKDLWKHLTLTLSALLLGALVTSAWHSGRLANIETKVQEIRERVVRIETKLEARTATDAADQVEPLEPLARWLQVGR